MKPRIGVYLSKRTAARLTTAAKRRGTTKSALVEAAIDRFLGSDDIDDCLLPRRLADLSGQIGQLDRDLGIVSEMVALHVRFHLAVTPELPAATQPGVCRLGSARFDEFAAQVGRRVELRTPLMRETMSRLSARRPTASATDPGEGGAPTAYEADFSASTRVNEVPENTAAVREDGSMNNFPVHPRSPLH
jgi:hypothetical protein